jgi:hypothetical protein
LANGGLEYDVGLAMGADAGYCHGGIELRCLEDLARRGRGLRRGRVRVFSKGSGPKPSADYQGAADAPYAPTWRDPKESAFEVGYVKGSRFLARLMHYTHIELK